MLIHAPVLITPNWSIIFHVHTDASGVAVGAVLAQPDAALKMDRPVHYASRLLNKAERNYSTTEREGLAIVYALHKFRHYLLGVHFVVITDHQALKYLLNKAQVAGRIWRWLLLFQEFDFEIMIRPGKDHVMADHLSRVTSGEAASSEGICDEFYVSPLEHEDVILGTLWFHRMYAQLKFWKG